MNLRLRVARTAVDRILWIGFGILGIVMVLSDLKENVFRRERSEIH